jgi:hypothetical protein
MILWVQLSKKKKKAASGMCVAGAAAPRGRHGRMRVRATLLTWPAGVFPFLFFC